MGDISAKAEVEKSADIYDERAVKELVTERVRLLMHRQLQKSQVFHGKLIADAGLDIALGSMICEISTYIHGLVDHHIRIDRKFPATWWDHFKERWFPKWALKRFPVKYESFYVNQPIYKAVCPHLNDDGVGQHVTWLLEQRDGTP